MDYQPRLCISAGHGMASRTPGKVDPGADILPPYSSEAAVVLDFCKRLDTDLHILFGGTNGYHMLRNGGVFYKADDEAASHACDLFIEWHTNASVKRARRDAKRVGVEVIYEDVAYKPFATAMAKALSRALKLPDRGARRRTDLAVLSPHPRMTQVLVELFFGSDADDTYAWRLYNEDAELAAINVMLDKWGWRRVTRLPRKWGRISRARYRALRFRRAA